MIRTIYLVVLTSVQYAGISAFNFVDNTIDTHGSANITSAAIGKRARKKRNYEAGMLVRGSMMQEPLRHFDKSWNDPDILKHTWKRFATKAKELEKRYNWSYSK